jgi:hypothetical protein
MEPPAALTLDGASFRSVRAPLFTWAAPECAVIDMVRADQTRLVPKVHRFFNAYLDADAFRREEFRKALAYVSHQFKFDPPVTPSVREDRAAALEIALRAAEISHAKEVDETTDDVDSSFVDVSLLVDGCATLALGYRYILGLYPTDSTLSKLGELAVRLVLLAECEYDPALWAARGPLIEFSSSPDQELAPAKSSFVPSAARQRSDVTSSLDTVSRRLKDQILLTA